MHGKEILSSLLANLWQRYKARVPYAAMYEKMVLGNGGEVHNDHIAFRTLNVDMGDPKEGFLPSGIAAISRIFEALGYHRKDRYDFKRKKTNRLSF